MFLTPKIVNIDDPYDFTQVDNLQKLQELQQRGATGFTDTQISEDLLDWSNERKFEEAAIEDALDDTSANGSAGAAQSQPSLRQQMDSGIIRQYSEEENGL